MSQGSQLGITRLRRAMLNCGRRDKFVDQYFTLMKNSFLAHQWVSALDFDLIYFEIFPKYVVHFDFDVIFTFL